MQQSNHTKQIHINKTQKQTYQTQHETHSHTQQNHGQSHNTTNQY